jgi:transcriptional regulator with XRE-family HTH domain
MDDIIKNLRKKNYLTQAEFAKKVGVTQGTVSQWEHGIISPNSNQLRAISDAFGVSIDSIVGKGKREGDTKLTDEEYRLIHAYRKANNEACENALLILENSARKKETAERAG